jgi:hypothetical protein
LEKLKYPDRLIHGVVLMRLQGREPLFNLYPQTMWTI